MGRRPSPSRSGGHRFGARRGPDRGGAGRVEDFPPAVEAGADAVLAASVFHFGKLRVGDVKAELARAGIPVR